MIEWVLSHSFHLLFLGINLLGVGVSCWATGVLWGDLQARKAKGENGTIAYATSVNLRQEVHRLIVQFGFVLLAVFRLQINNDLYTLPHPSLHLTATIIAITGAQSLVLLWGSAYGRWARVALRQMTHDAALAGGRREDDR